MSTDLRFFQIDAFIRESRGRGSRVGGGRVGGSRVGDSRVEDGKGAPFSGNPAAVCPLDTWLPDAMMQAIAMENNLSETAFFVREGDGFRLRWFTPTNEVDLCGHATLASAFVVFSELDPRREHVFFETRSGRLGVKRAGPDDQLPPGALVMDFPARPPAILKEAPVALAEGLGAQPRSVLAARDWVAVFDSAEQVRDLSPQSLPLARLPPYAVIVTAPGTGRDDDVDFVSRFFAPKQGIPEDPVTGSAHCTLVPYWANRLARTRLRARQVSARGGELICTLKGERVELAGLCRLVIRGRFVAP